MFKHTLLIAGAVAGSSLMAATAPAAAQSELVTIEFEQRGFRHGKISGFLSGIDADGDGRLYAVSRTISEMFGYPFGNELEYGQITYEGFGLEAPVTVTYDKSQADMEHPVNTFMAFAYNIDGGPIGDQADEGMSFAVFSPSINYSLGEFFTQLFSPSIVAQSLSACGEGLNLDPACAVVMELTPNPASPTGVDLADAHFSRAPVRTAQASLAGRSYAVEVTTNFGVAFDDCFRFNGFGKLRIDSLGQALAYRQAALGMSATEWLAVAPLGSELSLALSGTRATISEVRGDAVNGRGDSFSFVGRQTSNCSAGDGAVWMR